ncbi:sensor histidine kinase [Luteimonas aestuarii]|uniref:sensor histidine kinase n=1 Tax=Luteimonas aestuarii TaxID=453837 RepID=UPI001FB65BE0|nr:ATP-binding protein [Luteimonas aestuarii]
MEQRSEALQRFLGGYARLARLPPPQVRPLDIAQLCSRVHGLFAGTRFRIEPGESARVRADGDQIEQVLINLVRNALEADAQGVVVLRWRREAGHARIEILDNGHGLPSSDSLFVPFFTTKPGGSGIGLVLSRQIVEAQGGSLSLRPRDDAPGAVADVVLPLGDAMDA